MQALLNRRLERKVEAADSRRRILSPVRQTYRANASVVMSSTSLVAMHTHMHALSNQEFTYQQFVALEATHCESQMWENVTSC